ncbi:hypothetical protein E2C01_100953 [Portunus trituberculatus]|uniref:Secreted protein n=1 Tax=Portunus trituberculatus TaxID=210409 RepID=A0A5B7K8A1_PORTR|nr:hypothetical protein [Portunus trituberculatus]
MGTVLIPFKLLFHYMCSLWLPSEGPSGCFAEQTTRLPFSTILCAWELHISNQPVFSGGRQVHSWFLAQVGDTCCWAVLVLASHRSGSCALLLSSWLATG